MKPTNLTYQIIDHTADLGIAVKGADAKDLFANAAYAMIDIMVETDRVGSEAKRRIAIEGEDYPDLMVRWLGEILYLFDAEKEVVRDIEITDLGSNRLEAVLAFMSLEEGGYEIKMEIKAVTYHQISVERKNGEWEARIIFDI
ncbi:MAG: archease [Thermodesulfobacteriota bacterium]